MHPEGTLREDVMGGLDASLVSNGLEELPDSPLPALPSPPSSASASSTSPPRSKPRPLAANTPLYSSFNIYRSMLAGLNNEESFSALYTGVCRLLAAVPTAQGTLLPHSLVRPSCSAELVALLWKVCDDNPPFLAWVLDEAEISHLLNPLLFLMWSARSSSTKVGFLHQATFLLLLLSSHRSFSVGLNAPVEPGWWSALDSDITSVGDLLVLVLHRMFVDGTHKLEPLWTCWLTVITNVSPYLKVRADGGMQQRPGMADRGNQQRYPR